MASRRACLDVLRRSEALARNSSASSNLRNFSSQSSWTTTPQAVTSAKRRISPWSQKALKTPHATSRVLRHHRQFSSSPTSRHGHLDPPRPGEECVTNSHFHESLLTNIRRTITFIDKDSQTHTFTVADGDNLLDIAQANDLEMEGACGGSCACSTCHVIVDDEAYYEKMEEPDDDENDMLDLAFGLTETSRLGCQVKMSKELDGLKVRLPKMTRNLQAGDFK